MGFALDNPIALVLLFVVIPLLLLLSWKTRTYLPPARRSASLVARLVLASLLLLALSGPVLLRPLDRLTVVYLVDASDSIGQDGRQRELDFLRESIKAMGPRDQAGIVVFGQNALVELPVGQIKELNNLSSIPVTTHTDIAGALRVGMALLSNNAGRRIIILSDGIENVGSARNEIKLAAASQVQVSVVPLPGPRGPRVLISQVETPAVVRKTDAFDMRVTVESSMATSATLRLFTDGALTGEHKLDLKAGTNSYSFAQLPLPQGFHSFAAQLEAPQDPLVENKEGSSFSNVIGQPRVLIVEGNTDESKNLAAALQAAGTLVDVRAPTGLPPDLASLRTYDSLVLVNVPAADLTDSAMRMINQYVRDLGGGLVMIGGDKSYGAGSYGHTPLEEALPVTATVNPRKNLPSTAVVFFVESLESNLGVDISKEAAKAAVRALTPLDEVAVLDGNDGADMWVVPLSRLTDKDAVTKKIDAMQPQDPRSYLPFFQAAHDALKQSQAKTKHVIFLGDGDQPDAYEPEVRAMAADGITLSVVGTNVAPSDLGLLQNLAEWGKGRYYDGNDPFDIPQLLTREVTTIARPAIVEGAFVPAVTSGSPELQGIAVDSLPPLQGYIATTAKPTAQVIMASAEADPILSEWQYGLGRAIAWTSDAKGKWAVNWLGWPDYGKFWSQVVKRSMPAQIDQNVQTTVTSQGADVQITVDSMTPDHQFRDSLATSVIVFTPKGDRSEVTLDQSGPGRYQATFPATDQGTYLLQILQKDEAGNPVANQTSGYVIPYSPEYRELQPNTNLLGQLATATGGKVLTNPAQVFAHDISRAEGNVNIAPLLLLLALFVFLFDVGIRRLRFGAADVALVWYRVWRRGDADGVDTPSTRRIRGLRESLAKLRVEKSTVKDQVPNLQRRKRAARPAPPQPASSTFARVAANIERRPVAPVVVRDGVTQVSRAPIPAASRMGRSETPATHERAKEQPERRPVKPKRPAAVAQASTSRLLEAKERARKRSGG